MAAEGERQRHARVKEVFGAAMRWAEEDRAAVAAALAGDEADVRDEVLSLLAHHDDAPLIRDPVRGAAAAAADRTIVREATGSSPRSERTLAALLRAERADAATDAATDAAADAATSAVTSAATSAATNAGGRATRGAANEALPGWPIDRVVRALEPVARAIAGIADQGAVHGRICLARIAIAADGELAADLVAPGAGAREGEAEPELARADADCVAPEQLLPELGPVGPWTDVYRLALVCVELMLGRPVADGSVAAAFARARDAAVRPTPRAVGLDVPPGVEAALAMALATRPIERFQDVGRFWTALRDSVAASPPDATPPPASRVAPPERSGSPGAQRRVRRRHGAWAVPAAAIGLAIAAGLAAALRCG